MLTRLAVAILSLVVAVIVIAYAAPEPPGELEEDWWEERYLGCDDCGECK